MGAEYKGDLLIWYQANKVTADRIVNDLKKQSYEAVMHMYAYTAKSLRLENIVSLHDFPMLFSNNYTRVGDTVAGAMAFLLSEGNMNFANIEKVRNTLKYWLVYGNLYETLISKIMVKEEEVRERLERNAFSDLQQRLVATSIQNGIRTGTGSLVWRSNLKQKKSWKGVKGCFRQNFKQSRPCGFLPRPSRWACATTTIIGKGLRLFWRTLQIVPANI